MFLKRLQRRKSGKKHTYWALIESIRTARGSRHRVVAYLGELKKSERNGWAQLCRRLNKEQRPQPSLFDPPHYDDPTDDEPVLVKLKGIRLQRLRDFGDVWLALGRWRLLGLDTLLGGSMPTGQEEVSWATVAAILTIGRFVNHPVSCTLQTRGTVGQLWRICWVYPLNRFTTAGSTPAWTNSYPTRRPSSDISRNASGTCST